MLHFRDMKISYNLIAGQNVERLAALSDGIFAVAMTLLVLHALVSTAPQLLMYLMSFLTLGIF